MRGCFPHLRFFPVVLRGRPGTSACSSTGEPTTSKPGRPRMCCPHCTRQPERFKSRPQMPIKRQWLLLVRNPVVIFGVLVAALGTPRRLHVRQARVPLTQRQQDDRPLEGRVLQPRESPRFVRRQRDRSRVPQRVLGHSAAGATRPRERGLCAPGCDQKGAIWHGSAGAPKFQTYDERVRQPPRQLRRDGRAS